MSRVPYASIVGNSLHVVVYTRPDITHLVGVLSRYVSKLGKEHWTTVKSIFRYLHGTIENLLPRKTWCRQSGHTWIC
jgi:hypothetical protein